jgi:GAF domain-containing protein/anti-sigma regulatory factor (Ser/Thr protein kinase)
VTPDGSSQRSTLPRDPGAVALARRAVEQQAEQLTDGELEVARLLVSELVTNAVRHGAGEIGLSMRFDERCARFEVHDDCAGEARRRKSAGAEGGFGLNLVETLATRWGVDEHTAGVWFELERVDGSRDGGAIAGEAGAFEGVRSALSPPGWTRWWAVGSALALLLIAIETMLGDVPIVSALFVLPPLVCAALGRWGDTAVVAVVSTALALLHTSITGWGGRQAVVLVAVAVAALLTVLVALLRAGADVNLTRFRLLSAVADVGNTAMSLQDAVARLLDILVPRFADVALLEARAGGASVRRLGIRPADFDPTVAASELRVAPPASTIQMPLRARGQTVGTLSLLLGPSGRAYSRSDVAFAEVFGGRAAVVLDNAGLTSELHAVERQLDAVLHGLAEAVTVMDAEGRHVYANGAALELLRIDDPQELLGADPGARMAHFDVYDEHGAPVELSDLPAFRALAGELDPPPLLVRNVVKATGEERWLVNKTTNILDAEGRIVRIANVIEDVTETKRAELAQRLLAEASEVLASSLDYEQTLQRVAEVAVPLLADWCAVDLPGDDGTAQVGAVAHVDAQKVELARRLRARYPVALDEPGGLAAVLRGRPSFVVPEITDERLVSYARDDEHLEMLRATGMTSLMIVPLVAGAETLGALSLARTAPHRAFDEADRELAEELGRRAGTAILNARLYTERSAIAATLQRGLRPPELRAPPGFELASLYRAAGELNEVGGDFYDAFATDEGWMLVIGDVTGHGAEAAALTALARYTLLSTGQLTGDPARAMRQLNATLRDLPRLSLCTVVCAHLHAQPGGDGVTVTIANCGHPPPLRLRDGQLDEVGVSGPVAGAFDEGEWPRTDVELHAGDALVLYTDGVTDTVGAGERFGERRLHAALREAAEPSPQALLDRLMAELDAFRVGSPRDDTAAVALRFAP